MTILKNSNTRVVESNYGKIRAPKHLHTSLQVANIDRSIFESDESGERLYSSLRLITDHSSRWPDEYRFNNKIQANGSERYSRRQRIAMLALIYGNFWSAACVSLQAPFFPKEAEIKGATPTEYGLVFGIYELMILITSPLFGRLVSKYSAISICKFGLLLCGASVMSFGLIDRLPAGQAFITAAYLIRIVEGVAASAFMTTSYTVMAAIFPSNVTTVFSYLEMAFGLGLIVGPTIGGAVYELAGFSFPFTLIGGFLFIGYFVLHFCLRDTPSGTMKASQSRPNLLTFIADGGIIFDSLAIITSLSLIGFNSATLEPHIRQFGLSPFYTGLIFVINGATYATTTPIWGKLCDMKFDPKVLIVIGYLTCSIGLVILGPLSFVAIEPSIPLVIVSLIITGFGMSAKLVCSFVDAIDDSIKRRGMANDVGTYGLVSAMFFTSCSIGASVGPSVGGVLLDHYDYRPSTLVVFAIEVFMTTIGLIYIFVRRAKPASTALSRKSHNNISL